MLSLCLRTVYLPFPSFLRQYTCPGNECKVFRICPSSLLYPVIVLRTIPSRDRLRYRKLSHLSLFKLQAKVRWVSIRSGFPSIIFPFLHGRVCFSRCFRKTVLAGEWVYLTNFTKKIMANEEGEVSIKAFYGVILLQWLQHLKDCAYLREASLSDKI